MPYEIRKEPFDPWREIARYEQALQSSGKYGAIACFIGTMRDFNEGEQVTAMTLDYYPGMTDRHLGMICEEAGRRWDLIDVLLLHRVGSIAIGEPIVLVAVWSAHRAEAFAACRFVIEDLKARAPFWKQETTTSGRRWVEKNTPG